MVDIVKLKALIEQAPYDTMTDAELVSALNAPTVKVQQSITKAKLLQWAGANGGFTTINAAAAYSSENDVQKLAVQNAGMAAQALFACGDVPEFDTGSAENQAMLNLFVSVGIMAQSAVDSLLALGAVMKTPEEVAGVGGYVNFGDIAEARAS